MKKSPRSMHGTGASDYFRRFLDIRIGRDPIRGPDTWAITVYWFPNYYAVQGEIGWWHVWSLIWYVSIIGARRRG